MRQLLQLEVPFTENKSRMLTDRDLERRFAFIAKNCTLSLVRARNRKRMLIGWTSNALPVICLILARHCLDFKHWLPAHYWTVEIKTSLATLLMDKSVTVPETSLIKNSIFFRTTSNLQFLLKNLARVMGILPTLILSRLQPLKHCQME